MSSGNARRVAVIAIHGVGDHLPDEMAKAAGSMLESRRDRAGNIRYSNFEEDRVRINVGPVELSRTPVKTVKGKRVWGPLDAMRLSGKSVMSAAAAKMDSIDHVFMEGQLSGYQSKGPEDTYEFLRLEGVRKPEAAVLDKLVHVYDMFWSDLSGVGQAGLRIFGELYQLLFHLGSVGVNNVAAAAAFFRGKAGVAEKWDAFTEAQKRGAGVLALPIPFLNLVLLIVAAALFATAAIAKLTAAQQWVVAAVAVIAVIAAVWAYSLKKRGKFSGASFRAPLLVALAGSAIAAWKIESTDSLQGTPEIAQSIIAALVFGAGLFGAAKVVSAYEKRRPRASRAFWLTLLAVLVITVFSAYRSHPWFAQDRALTLLLRSAEVCFWLLTGAWFLFWALMILAGFFGHAAVNAVQSSKLPGISSETDRARRTNWTAQLTIGLPASMFLLVTFAAWSGLLHAALPLLRRAPALAPAELTKLDPSKKAGEIQLLIQLHCQPPDAKPPDTVCYSPLKGRSGVEPARSWAIEAFYEAGVGVIPMLLLLTGIAALIALYGVVPSIVAEVVSPPSWADPHKSRELGDWLDQGFSFMRTAGWCLYIGVFLFPPVMLLILAAIHFDSILPHIQFLLVQLAAVNIHVDAKWVKWAITAFENATTPFAETIGALVGGTAAGVLAFGGRLSKLALGLRTSVRVGLDVDNWLREHPHGTNPTARICARYVSLLRYIAQWRDENGQPYGALVIFAHSQGTVITADLLRFLHVEATPAAGGNAAYDPTLAGLRQMEIYLFTCGCPLRQLYGQRFPYIYGYAHTSPAGTEPEPADLGVTGWTNGYRTGDYIGRYLWRSTNQFTPGIPFVNGPRSEFAIGPGAHTHYWDKTGDAVADKLDELIARA
jgi:hypothetical protein